MPRPAELPRWATNLVIDPVNNLPNKTALTSQLKDSGVLREEPFGRTFLNQILSENADWIEYLDETLQAAIGGFGANPTEAAYPIGSVYITTSSAATVPFTFGTWSEVGQGRVLMGQDPNDPAFDGVGETGGAKSHTHNIGSLEIADHRLTISEMPQHAHPNTGEDGVRIIDEVNVTYDAGGIKVLSSASINGTGLAHTKLLSGYMGGQVEGGEPQGADIAPWETPSEDFSAGAFNGDVDDFGDVASGTDNLYDGAGHSHGFSGNISTDTNLPPYLVVKMWERIS